MAKSTKIRALGVRGAGAWVVLLCVACDPGPGGPVLDLPLRQDDAPGGTEIGQEIRELDLEVREERIFREISLGNVPNWMRRLRQVDLSGEVDGHVHRVTFWVTADYLTVGSDEDPFLIPLSPRMAQRIGDLVACALPTPKMVDAIWAGAEVRLAPIRIGPDRFMATVGYFERHDRLIRGQRYAQDVPLGAFVAGDKLDVVVTPKISASSGMVAVYGWHRTDGQPIQPLLVDRPEDKVLFSHGIRLVARQLLVDGTEMDLLDVLADPALAPLLSDEGVFVEEPYRPTAPSLSGSTNQ